MKKILLLICSLLLLVSCEQKRGNEHFSSSNSYAKGFEINTDSVYTVVKVFSPWKAGEVLQTYYLVHNDSIATPNDGLKLLIPISHLTTTSCTHIGFISELNQLHSVIGVCNPQIVYNSQLQTLVTEGKVQDVGDAMTPNVELIMHSGADAVMVSTYAQGDAVTEKLVNLGIPVIYNNEWTESTPLARAEWIKFVAAFYDCSTRADSLFREIEKEYKLLAALTTDISQKRTIMSGNNFRGTWYMPSGNTYMGVLFRDAGADYYFQNDTSHFSIPLTIENVILNFGQADVWVGSSAHSMQELAEMDDKHTWFRAYKTKQVFNFYKTQSAYGANDFWESGVVHPERILHDLILLLYPEKIEDKQFYYTTHIE